MKCGAQILAITLAFSALSGAWGQFYAVMPAPNCTESKVTGLSADGRTASGWSADFLYSHQPGFTWSANGGLSNFGGLPGMPSQTYTSGISGDGGTVVGGSNQPPNTIERAFRYDYSSGLHLLGSVGNYAVSEAHGVNNDGSVIVGNAHDSADFSSSAWRWTESGGMQSLGYTRPGHFYSDATAISRDGSTIVGYSFGGSTHDTFVWTAATGMSVLQGLNGASASAFGVNKSGSIIVGQTDIIGGATQSHAAMWINSSILDLGLNADMRRANAQGVSDDGSVVVGVARILAAPVDRATIWTASTGLVWLDSYVAAQGITVPSGWTFGNATAVSADGRTIAGSGSFGNGHMTGFVVTIPSPAAPIVFLALGLRAIRRRREQ